MEHFIQRTQENSDVILPGADEPTRLRLVATGLIDTIEADFLKRLGSSRTDGSQSPMKDVYTEELPSLLNLDVDERQYYDAN